MVSDTWVLGLEGKQTGLSLSAKVAPMQKGGATDLVPLWSQAALLGPSGWGLKGACPSSGPGKPTALGGYHAAYMATFVSGNGSCRHTQYHHWFLPDNGYIVSSTFPHTRHQAKGFMSLIPFNSHDH